MENQLEKRFEDRLPFPSDMQGLGFWAYLLVIGREWRSGNEIETIWDGLGAAMRIHTSIFY